jgi:predicted transcriptional regulator
MKNITLAIDGDVLDRVREIAARKRTTVNAIVREHLTKLASEEFRIAEARRRLLELSDASEGRLGPDWKWNREDAYAGRVLPRHEHPPVRRSRRR